MSIRPTILLYTQILLIFIIMIFPTLVSYLDSYNNPFQAAAQTTTASSDLAKVLVDSAVQDLQSGNIVKTILHLKAAELELVLLAAIQGNENTHTYCSSLQSLPTISVLNNAIQSLETNNNTTKAIMLLDVAETQLGESLLNASKSNICATTSTVPTGTFLIYTNPVYGIKIQYQYDWIIQGTRYHTGPVGTGIVSFYLPDTKNGLPFFRIGVDDLSKEFPKLRTININNYLNESLEDKNSIGFLGFKLLGYNTHSSLGGNRAYSIVWTYNGAIYGMRKSIEIGTVIGNKGYFVDYTAAEAKFQYYLPIAQKMINSFEIVNSTG